MNESDSEGSSGNEGRSKDLEKLHNIWKNIKQAKHKEKERSHHHDRQSNQKSIGSVKQAIHQEQQKNLQTRLAMTQKQLSKSRQNTALLMKKLSQAEEQIDFLSFELQKQRKEKQETLAQNQQLRYRIIQIEKEKPVLRQTHQDETFKQQVETIRRRMESKDKQVDRLTLKIKSLELDRSNQDIQIKNLSELNQSYLRQISETEHAINEVYLGQQSKGAQLLELDEAHKTIQRLVYLLRTTEEYHNLGNFAEDSKDVHFLKNVLKRLKMNQLNHAPPEKKKLCSCMQVRIDQRLLWTAAASYRIMLDMKIKYDSLTQDCIEEVLFELNKIWLARQESHVKRVKQSFEYEINRLKKKGQIRYDQMVARKQIQRLKKELQGAKNCRKSNNTVNIESLKSTGQYQDELRLKQKEVRLLQERIRLIETETNNGDKVLYMEGALWIIDKVITEMETNEEDIREFEVRFRDKIEDNISQDDWIRSYKEFFENITEIQNVLLEKLFMMKQSTLKKMGNHKNSGKDSLAADLNRRY